MNAMEKLESMGYCFTLSENGNIRAELRGGLMPPPEASKLLAWCKAHREEVRDELIFRSGKVQSTIKVDTWHLEEEDERLRKWLSIFERGMAELIRVRVHKRSERVEIHYTPLVEAWVIESELNARTAVA